MGKANNRGEEVLFNWFILPILPELNTLQRKLNFRVKPYKYIWRIVRIDQRGKEHLKTILMILNQEKNLLEMENQWKYLPVNTDL